MMRNSYRNTTNITRENTQYLGETFEVALGSGAGKPVTAQPDAPGYEVKGPRGSRVGQKFKAAGEQL